MSEVRTYWPNAYSPFYVFAVEGGEVQQLIAVFDFPPAYGPAGVQAASPELIEEIRQLWAATPGDAVRFPLAGVTTLDALPTTPTQEGEQA